MTGASRRIWFGQFELDCERGELRRSGEFVVLARKPLSLLLYLVEHRGRAVPKRELLEQLWPDVFVTETALSSAIKDLRRALGDDGVRQQIVQTLRRRGFRFAAEVHVAPIGPDARAADGSGAKREPGAATDFVGRSRELSWLSDRVAEVADGRPRVALIVGEPGLGKSRLVEELEAEPACAGFEFITGRCQIDAPLPYLPFVEALSEWSVQNDEVSDQILGADAGALRQLLHPESTTVGPVLNFEISIGERRRAELFAAIYRSFEKLARRGRIALVIEDLHAADFASLDLLDHFVGALSDAWSEGPLPLLVIATLRPPADGDRVARSVERLEHESICDRLDLAGLDSSAVRELVERLGGARLPARGLAEIFAVTRGNPFLVREFLRQGGSNRKRLRAARHALGARPAESARPRPRQIGAALGSRIDGLRRRTRDVLTVAAFIGERFGLLALSAACRLSPELVAATLAEAQDAGLLEGERRSFRFSHSLVREALQSATPPAERAEIHRDIADVLEDLYASATGEHALEIAQHLILAGDSVEHSRLLHYARRAADQAFAVCAWHDAARFYDAATCASKALPPAERAALHFRAGTAVIRDGNPELCRQHYTKAAELFAQIGDDEGRARVLMFLLRLRITSAAAASGEPADLSTLIDLTMKLADEQPALCSLILETVSEAYWTAGDSARAQIYAERALHIGKSIDDDSVCSHARMGLALASFSLMQVRDAVAIWRSTSGHGARATHGPPALPAPASPSDFYIWAVSRRPSISRGRLRTSRGACRIRWTCRWSCRSKPASTSPTAISTRPRPLPALRCSPSAGLATRGVGHWSLAREPGPLRSAESGKRPK